MINNKRKIIFIHVPRTGGTSVKAALEFGRSKRRGIGYHERWDLVKQSDPIAWQEYFKFSIVRNPWDRVYSIYTYYRYGGKKVTKVDPSKMPSSFGDFVYDLAGNLDKLGIGYTQSEFIGEELDFVLRFEYLREDFSKMCELANIRPEPYLPHARRSEREEDYFFQYSRHMREIVAFYFKEDIERFNYTFDDLSDSIHK